MSEFQTLLGCLALLVITVGTGAFAQKGDVINPPPRANEPTEKQQKEDDAVYSTRLEVPVGEGQILIKAVDGVPPAALSEARKIVVRMLMEADPEVCKRLGSSKLHIAIIPKFKKLTDLPEFRHLSGSRYRDGRLFDHVRGVTAVSQWRTPMVATSEENLLRLISTSQSTMHHEFGHAVHLVGLTAEQRKDWANIYTEARKRGQFGNLYAMSNDREFFAELTQAYFNMSPDFCSRDRLAVMNPAAFDLLSKVYSAQPQAGPAPKVNGVPTSPDPGLKL
jgi:hypothetical protein